MQPDCYASQFVSGPCCECDPSAWVPAFASIIHVVAEKFYCSAHCPICSAEGERRQGAKLNP